MKQAFVNFSNHPSAMWTDDQRIAAEEIGEIVDLAFPEVAPLMQEEDLRQMIVEYVNRISALNPKCVMCQGEYTLCYGVVNELLRRGICCVAACSRREMAAEVMEDGHVKKQVEFRFCGFRKYLTMGEES